MMGAGPVCPAALEAATSQAARNLLLLLLLALGQTRMQGNQEAIAVVHHQRLTVWLAPAETKESV